MRSYVLGIVEPRERVVAELYLARFAGFVLDPEGTLGFGVDDAEADLDLDLNCDGDLERGLRAVGKSVQEQKWTRSWGVCVVM